VTAQKIAGHLYAFLAKYRQLLTTIPMNIRNICLLILFVTAGRLSATELYNLDFTPPEVGSYEVIFGKPTVQSSVGPFTDALVFHAVTTYDQIRLPITADAQQYNIQYDVFTHNLVNSQYTFDIALDTPQVRTVALHGGQNAIEVYQPFAGVTNIGALTNDQVYHFEIRIDLVANVWSVAVDGMQRFSHAFESSELRSLRFTMSPWIANASDAPGTYAALDNVVVTDVPEPSSAALALIGLVVGLGAVSVRSRFRARRRSCFDCNVS
jgi:PEP-CTERM motif-containing protein